MALLAGLIAVAVVERSDDENVPVAGGSRRRRRRVVRRPGSAAAAGGDAERTSCGLTLTTRSLGVTHPVLPCGAKLLVRYGGETILTEVIDNELVAPRAGSSS